MRIVLTRHPGQAGALEAELSEAGYDVGFLPVTDQRLPADTRELTTALGRLAAGEYRWLVVTSANTVRALRRCGWSGELPPATETAVTGPGTARVLAELTSLHDPWTPSGAKSAAGILEEFPRVEEDEDPGRGSMRGLLLPQSAQSRSELAEGLRGLGWEVDRIVAYETVPRAGSSAGPSSRSLVPGGDASGEVLPAELGSADELTGADVVLITSSTAAEACIAQIGAPSHAQLTQSRPVGPGGDAPMLLAIGAPTAETLRRLGRPPDGVLHEPTAVGVRQFLSAA